MGENEFGVGQACDGKFNFSLYPRGSSVQSCLTQKSPLREARPYLFLRHRLLLLNFFDHDDPKVVEGMVG